MPKTRDEIVIFYGSIIRQTVEVCHNTLEEMTSDKILADYVRNIYSLALVQKNKFRFLKASLVFMVSSAASLIVAPAPAGVRIRKAQISRVHPPVTGSGS